MKIAVCGARGRAGSRIVDELLRRGHEVIALVRSGGDAGERDGVTVVVDDLSDARVTAANIAGSDALVSAYAPPGENTDVWVAVTARLREAVHASGVPRLRGVGARARWRCLRA